MITDYLKDTKNFFFKHREAGNHSFFAKDYDKGKKYFFVGFFRIKRFNAKKNVIKKIVWVK